MSFSRNVSQHLSFRNPSKKRRSSTSNMSNDVGSTVKMLWSDPHFVRKKTWLQAPISRLRELLILEDGTRTVGSHQQLETNERRFWPRGRFSLWKRVDLLRCFAVKVMVLKGMKCTYYVNIYIYKAYIIYIYTTSFIQHRTAVLSLYCLTVDTGVFRTLTLCFRILSHDSWRSTVRIRNMEKVKKSGQMAPGLPAVDFKQSAGGIQAIKLPILLKPLV